MGERGTITAEERAWAAIQAAEDPAEDLLVRALAAQVPADVRASAVATARLLVQGARARSAQRTLLDAFLLEFGLSNAEGVALLCLAETLLRVPDDATVDRLIAEKLARGDWASHAGRSDSLFVNASTWGLMLTGRLVAAPEEARRDPAAWARALGQRLGEPVVRSAMKRAIRILADEFVVGRDIEAALDRAQRDPELGLCSYDMLGEGARTLRDAERYFESYAAAIDAIARRAAAGGPSTRPSISVKLSALEPRYHLSQAQRVRARLLPRALELARRAAGADIGLTIDAEESDRLELSLSLLDGLIADTATRHWPGLGLAVQAYGKRAPAVIEWIAGRARAAGRRMSVRLVKGAYWDTEIKRAQERGLASYPVYTRKVSTDVAYLACAKRLLAERPALYPQFATHNAMSIAGVFAFAPDGAGYEFQRLHGMGVLLYREAKSQIPSLPPVRVYAPVGPHSDLLAYLVRRLLENGANTSFVNRFLDDATPVERLVLDPVDAIQGLDSIPHPAIPSPPSLFGAARRNSRGLDLGRSSNWRRIAEAVAPRDARSTLTRMDDSQVAEVRNPARRSELLATLAWRGEREISAAFDRAETAWREWSALGGPRRAELLERAADRLEDDANRFLGLLVREAGKTAPDAWAEIRETADFLRYYAAEARRLFAGPIQLRGPTGETNEHWLEARGVLACVSPWNFPLAIYIGQIAGALAAGNAAVAKPAEATPLVAQAATELLHAAGVPEDVLHCLPAVGPIFGRTAFAHPALAGVVFTGSTVTATTIQRALAARAGPILPLVAETGGLNAMVVDSSALVEQVVDDVVLSAFGSAGQRCSALRLLFVQEDIAERTLEMLEGAMDELVVGDPADRQTDVGPVISAGAAASLARHVEEMRRTACVRKACPLDSRHADGSFFAPHLIELDEPRQLRSEQFGPVLHVVRWRGDSLDRVIEAIESSGYHLTLGVHSRLESVWQRVRARCRAGNVYVNRNMIGAVVGVQPFGGSGLSGTGPKAGGPHYLIRLATERTLTVNTSATGGDAALLRLE